MKRILAIALFALALAACNNEETKQKSAQVPDELESTPIDLGVLETKLTEEYGINLEGVFSLKDFISIHLKYDELTEADAKRIASEVLHFVQQYNPKQDVKIFVQHPIMDVYGNKTYNVALDLSVSVDTLSKFDFENFNTDDLNKAADEYFWSGD